MRFFGLQEEKFKELLLYIARKSETDPRFGAVKLNKILFYADFAAYRLLGRPITGAEYQNLQEGPAPRVMLPMSRELVSANRAKIETRPYYDRTQQRLVAYDDPNLDLFTAKEIEIVDNVIADLWLLTAQGCSDRSHLEFGYKATNRGETIPYSTAWISPDALTAEQIEVGMGVAERHGLIGTAG
jgi:hypothetical protein